MRPVLGSLRIQYGVGERTLLMKLLASAAVGLVFFVGIAQNQIPLGRWACLTSSACKRSDDAGPEAQEFARTAKVGRWWPDGNGNVVATFEATHIETDPTIFRLKGNAEITTAVLIVQADEAEYHWDTGEIEARGNVHVKPVSVDLTRARALRQFGIK